MWLSSTAEEILHGQAGIWPLLVVPYPTVLQPPFPIRFQMDVPSPSDTVDFPAGQQLHVGCERRLSLLSDL